MSLLRWVLGGLFLAALLGWVIYRPFAAELFAGSHYVGVAVRGLNVMLVAAGLCLFRVMRGPTAADRVVAVDILGILIVGFCAILAIATQKDWYIDIAIAWALQSFVVSLALSKYLEGRSFHD